MSKRYTQSGFGHIIAIFLLVIVAGFLLVVFKAVTSHNGVKGKNQNQALQSTTNDTAGCNYQDAELCQFQNKQKTPIYTYEQIETEFVSGKETSKRTSRVVNEHKAFYIDQVDGNSIDTLYDSGKQYMKRSADNLWLNVTALLPKTSGNPIQPVRSQFLEGDKDAAAEQPPTYTRLGVEKCGSLDCLKYKVTVSNYNQGAPAYVWFDTKDYLLQHESFKLYDQRIEIAISYKSLTIPDTTPNKVATAEDYKALIE